MIRVTFLSHSGFWVETPSAALLFDWWKGDLPPRPAGKPLLVFVSHRHGDHFNPEIFSLDAHRFLLGKDLRLTQRNMEKWNLSPETAERCIRLGGNETAQPIPGVTVETLPSTDEGVAFVVTVDQLTLYHAGDLHWWHWAGEDLGWNRNMEVSFKRALEPLQGRRIDLAMAPLDPRLEDAYGWGLAYLLRLAHVSRVLPMHQWEDFGLTARFCQEYPDLAAPVVPIGQNGQTFTFETT